ncbi:hydrogenase 4 subunit B [Azospirillum halopraeferens]|uniref:hydrogenase 4 subunit B n=1 Tax=Azospirillum halopraeferens TaxID=34010 RepID=UPI00040F0941|nr:hydrogenase 4 subunit B [Azospirillum halopraeferens]
MAPLLLLTLSLLAYAGGGTASLLLGRNERAAIATAGLSGAAAAVLGLAASLPVVIAGAGPVFDAAGPYPFARFVLRFDALAAFMVLVISLISLVTSIYSLAYVREYSGRGVGAMGFFMNLFIASMMLVVVVDNAFWFLIFFEMMTLASYFLVIFDRDEKSVSAGFLYFLVAHAGSVAIMAAFFILAAHAGSFDFEAFRHTSLSPGAASVVFLLGFLGFGAKAGMIPLHIWLPSAHPAAPSHASALMSGVMIKIGVFGIIKVGVDLLGGGIAWWGLLVLACGAVSSVLGVIYALAEHDIKKLLAYHSVENIGIILMGVGVGMVGVATEQPAVAVLGFLAGLYHLLNHAVFKGLLFLGAGAVISRMHTKDMEEMGGLARRMPWTAAAFLTGALAISAIPPLNGFVSEWFAYQALFSAALGGSFGVKLLAPVAAVALALTGALAVMCFVKAYGVTFTGQPRSAHAAHATEVPKEMLAGMGVLAGLCVLLGLGAPVVAPVIGRVAAAVAGQGQLALAHGTLVAPGSLDQAALSTPLVAVLLLGLLTLPLAIVGYFKGRRSAGRRTEGAWHCGYAEDPHMAATAGSFAASMKVNFRPLYRVRTVLNHGSEALDAGLRWTTAMATRVEPTWDAGIVAPVTRGVQAVGQQVQRIQQGDFRVYCLYIVAALVVLLFAAVR